MKSMNVMRLNGLVFNINMLKYFNVMIIMIIRIAKYHLLFLEFAIMRKKYKFTKNIS